MVAVILRALDRQRAPNEVDVLPSEPQRLAPAQPGQQDQLQVGTYKLVVEREHGIHPRPKLVGFDQRLAAVDAKPGAGP
jgi:hypothetical protein